MKVCIIGKNSYIGNHIDEWLTKKGHEVFQLDVLAEDWRAFDYSGFNAIVHVAGIVHRPNCKDEKLYHEVNTIMPTMIAEKFKRSTQSKATFVFLSTMAVFGIFKRLSKNVITADTPISPMGLYGQSKAAAEESLLKLQDGRFDVVVVRPPNVYGKNCRGNYISGFVQAVKKLPVIPVAYTNVKQSMLYIDNLCEFIRLSIEQKRHGVFMPQDDKAVSAVEITTAIARALDIKPRNSRLLGLAVHLGCLVPLIQKAYGGVEYDMSLSRIEGMDYVVVPFEEAMKRTIN